MNITIFLREMTRFAKTGFFKTEYHAYDYAEKRRYSKRYYKRGAGK